MSRVRVLAGGPTFYTMQTDTEAVQPKPELGKKPRIMFLDIDGPLHDADLVRISAIGDLPQLSPGVFDWAPQLKELLDPHPDVDVVVHSAWRFYGTYPGEALKIAPKWLQDRICDYTSREFSRREASIDDYLEGCGGRDRVSYVILDDARSEFSYMTQTSKEFVWCPPTKGLSDPITYNKVKARLEQMKDEV